jgi:two-component system phosphate regulon sensor histidine kinase PhoR
MPRLALSFRTKLLATYVALVAAVVGGVLYAVDRKLGDDLVQALDERVEAQAVAVAGWLAGSGHPPRLAKRLARVVDARVTVIDAFDIVEGDSMIDEDRLGVDPEGASAAVAAAREGKTGREIRYSPLAGKEMYYLAVAAGTGRVIRLAVPTEDIENTRRELRNRLLLISLFGLGGALVLGLFATRAVARPLQSMTRQARRLGEGDYEAHEPLRSPDELGVLSRTLSSLAGQVRDRIDDLERERDFLSSVIGSLVEGVVVVDQDGRMALENPKARDILDQERGEELGDAELRDVVARAVERGSPAEAELELRGRSLLVTAQPLKHRDAAAVLVLYDVTRLRRLETVRRDFVANLTHELRTPVTAIRGYAETLESANVDPATRAEFLQTIHRNAVRIGRLVDDLLVLQELDARPHARLAVDPVEVAPLVQNVIRTAQPHAERAGVALKSSVAPGLEVLADADRLEQVVQNLVDNAIKYGGGEVRIAGEKSGGEIRLTVEDDGPGIQPDHLERVFERFYRVDAGRSREQGGSGLGLAIVKHLTESMGGSVAVDSRVGAGTRFTVRLRGAA